MGITKVAIVMDPVEQIHIDQDTTFALALEAQKREFEVWVAYPENVFLENCIPKAKIARIEFKRDNPCFKWLSEPQVMDLDSFDFVLMRKDPPFDERYFFDTHLLSLCKKAKVLNRQSSLRNAPEKLYALNFPEVNPPSLISADSNEIKRFLDEAPKGIIIKPLNKCGGSGIVYLAPGDRNFYSLIEMSTDEGRDRIVAQHYLPDIRNGDKRVICVNGEPEGAILRVPDAAEHRGNIHVGGKVISSDLTERDLWLIDKVKQRMVEDGLYFVGLDIIGDYITEINVTSPTGIQEIHQLGGKDIAAIFWDRIDTFQG